MKNLINKYNETMQTLARIHLTMHDSEHKLAGIQSLSTSVLENPICQARRKVKGSVCEKCYAAHLVAYRKNLNNCLIRNYKILTDHLLDKREAASCQFMTALGRIESFGDVSCVTHARNYIRIERANPQTRFVIFSKNLEIYHEAFELEGKPRNTTFVYSSPNVNEIAEIPAKYEDMVDHVFTVHDKAHYTEYRGTPSECNRLRCLKCQKCWKRTSKKNPRNINEELR